MGVPDGLVGTVTSIGACPAIEDGPGRVVLMTVNHLNDLVYHLTLTDDRGDADSIGVTGYHKIYTEDRGWVSTCDLYDGEMVRSSHGDVTVTGLVRSPGAFTVYNMTVESDHVYYVGDLTALVHNNNCRNTNPIGKRKYYNTRKEAEEAARRAGKGADPIHHPDGEFGPHFHPDVPMPPEGGTTPHMPNPHDHYYD